MEEKESKPVRVGVKMQEAIEYQKQLIKEACHDCVSPSDTEAAEIIARKFLKEI